MRATVAVVLVGALVWFVPRSRPGVDGGHHAGHDVEPVLDAFEKAGISEFEEGQRGPAFSLATLDGHRAALADYRDALVILNFWATWCVPCTDEMPTLEALWKDYRARGLVVLGVSVDRGAPRALLDPYVRNLALTFPILLDPDGKTASAWRVTALPATFVVKPGGEVAGNAVGARDWRSEAMQALLTGLLPATRAHR
ncbi:MAG: TlpA family protein disulfide reductase [Candidatus Rokubacteria bacterium]|nr:TlpA family protein disulfide reductase [Candidatus Rokubacteria bacterium]